MRVRKETKCHHQTTTLLFCKPRYAHQNDSAILPSLKKVKHKETIKVEWKTEKKRENVKNGFSPFKAACAGVRKVHFLLLPNSRACYLPLITPGDLFKMC